MADERFPTWATDTTGADGTTKIDPGAPSQAEGWLIEHPPFEHMNWILNLLGVWLGRAVKQVHIATGTQVEHASANIPTGMISVGDIITLPNTFTGDDGKFVEFWPGDQFDERWVSYKPVLTPGAGGDFTATVNEVATLIMNLHSPVRLVLDETAQNWILYSLDGLGDPATGELGMSDAFPQGQYLRTDGTNEMTNTLTVPTDAGIEFEHAGGKLMLNHRSSDDRVEVGNAGKKLALLGLTDDLRFEVGGTPTVRRVFHTGDAPTIMDLNSRVLDNNAAIQGKLSGGATRSIAFITAGDVFICGDENLGAEYRGHNIDMEIDPTQVFRVKTDGAGVLFSAYLEGSLGAVATDIIIAGQESMVGNLPGNSSQRAGMGDNNLSNYSFSGRSTGAGSQVDAVGHYIRRAVAVSSEDAYYYENFGNSALFRVDYEGNVYGTSWTTLSDRKLKQDIYSLAVTDAVAKLMQLKPVCYRLKAEVLSDAGAQEHLGFIAQEVQEVLPNLVHEVTKEGDEQTTLGIRQEELIALLVETVQQQQQQIETLTTRVNALDAMVTP